ncbi:MAG: efflux RND transporter periplasmic adaptor subunit [Desulfomonile tiedjei]|nr:efflux RND transporter periplasmic adaptor subunit [Desulfomonile tiedjei]
MEKQVKFRVDLETYAYDDIAHRDTVVLKDPLSGKYFYLSVYEHRLLKALDGNRSLEEAREALGAAGYYYTPEAATAIVGKAAQLGLVLGTKYGTAEYQTLLKKQTEAAKKAKMFSSVYFLFIPLLNPDKFLERTLWMARLIGNMWTVMLLALALPGAIYCIISGIPKIQTEYLFFFNMHNLLCLWATLALAKLVHEFAHAYVAKHYGIHVPQMGVAFLIFFPCLFCNTTDAWQLADRKQRIAISAAGILVEGAVAIISAYVWYFTSPGIVNSLAFYLMAVSFISTVLFNGNPLMRFDGYFVLMDLLKLPNLSTRSMAYCKYLFLNRVLGMSQVANPATTRREVAIFAVYGVSAFLYRIFLYVGIVSGVYFRFDKTLGILLAVVAFALFIVRPLIRGIKTIYAQRAELHLQPAGLLGFGLLVALVIAALSVPVASRSIYPATAASAQSQKLTVPLQSCVDQVFIREGAQVACGDLLFTLDSSQLKLELAARKIERERLQKDLRFLLLDERRRDRAAGKAIEIRRVEDQIKRVARDLAIAQGGIVAPFDGVITRLDFRLQEGFQPGEGVVVGEVEAPSDCLVQALVPSADLHKVRTGQVVRMWFPLNGGKMVTGEISEIRPYSEQDLKDSPFSSRYGGEIATEPKGPESSEVPLEDFYRCSVKPTDRAETLPLGMSGKLIVDSPPRSLLTRVTNRLIQTFNKEYSL